MSEDEKTTPPAPNNDDFVFPDLHADEPASAPVAVPVVEIAAPVADKAAVTGNPDEIKPTAKPAQNWAVKNKKIALFLGFVAVAGGMYGINWIRNHNTEPQPTSVTPGENPEEVPVNALEVRLSRFQDYIKAVGTLKGEVEVELRFQVDGRIEDLNFQEGIKVRKGQVLARISDRDARLKVERAKLELEQTEKLYQLGGVSKTKVDETRLNLEVALSELDKTRIVASRDGIIGEKEAEIGEFVNPQKKIAKLVSIKNVIVEIGIIEKQVDKVYPGQKVLVTVDAYPGSVFEGMVESISPIIGVDGSKTFSMRSKIPNPGSQLLPGMFARSTIITYEKDDAISIPNEALIKTTGGFQVFVVNKDSIAEEREVQVGFVATEYTEIISGLAPGDIVINQKPPELKPGSRVKITEVQK